MSSRFKSMIAASERLIERHRLTTAIAIIIGIALLLTTLNMWLYVQSGASGLDLSRPGYASAREDIIRESQEVAFSAEGPLSETVIGAYLASYRKEKDKLDVLGAFDATPLSNQSLGFDIGETDTIDPRSL